MTCRRSCRPYSRRSRRRRRPWRAPAADADMAEPRVKVYGLVRLTRRAYLACQVVAVFLAVAVLALGLFLPRHKEEHGQPLVPFVRFFNGFLDLLPWIALLLLILVAVETYVVLKKFDREASRAASAAGES